MEITTSPYANHVSCGVLHVSGKYEQNKKRSEKKDLTAKSTHAEETDTCTKPENSITSALSNSWVTSPSCSCTCHDATGNKNMTPGHLSSTTLSSDTCTSDSSQFQIETFKATIKRLYQENKSNVKTVEKMSDLLKEAQQHQADYQKQLAKYENVLFVYKSRLIELGASTQTEFQDDETFYPGVSRQTLLNLAKENSVLKQQMKFSDVDPREMEALEKKVDELQKQLEAVNNKCDKFKTECEKLRSVVEGSNNEKDMIIQSLQTQLDSFHQNSLTQDVLCQSLNEETHSLKKQLRDVSSQCQELAQKLGERDRQNKGQSREKNDQVEAKLKEVIEINSNWQSYNDQREVYVQRLQQELNELKKKSKPITNGSLSEEQQKNIDKILVESKKKVDNMEDENIKLEDEIRSLSIQKDGLKRDNEKLIKHIQHLEKNKSTRPSSNEDRDKIQVLQAQVEILSEDFRLERQDREVAQSRITALEEELHAARRRPMENNSHYGRDIPTKRALALQHYQDDYYRQQNNRQRLTERGQTFNNYYLGDMVETDGADDTAEAEHRLGNNHHNDAGLNLQTDGGFDEIDGGYDEADICKTDTLQCPRCQKEYPTDRHDDLLEHIDMCCD